MHLHTGIHRSGSPESAQCSLVLYNLVVYKSFGKYSSEKINFSSNYDFDEGPFGFCLPFGKITTTGSCVCFLILPLHFFKV